MGMEEFQFQPSGACELVPKITEQHQRLYWTAALAESYKGRRENETEREKGDSGVYVFWAMQDSERDRKKKKIEEVEVCEERGLGVREKRRQREGKKEMQKECEVKTKVRQAGREYCERVTDSKVARLI